MNTYRKTAIIVGALFFLGTVSGILSAVFTGSILTDPDYLIKVSTSQNQIVTGALFLLLMALTLAMVPVVMYPISKKYSETLALGYVIFRGGLETILCIPMVASWLLLITLGKEYVVAGTQAASYFQTLGTLILSATDWINPIAAMVFCLGALMFYYVLYQSKLTPRWLSGWGFLGAILYLVVNLINMFNPQLAPLSLDAGLGILMVPLFLQEMFMAVWLIVKGFNPSAIAALAVKTDMNQQKAILSSV
jgi:Domain of unknown function (DUF4386)